MARYIVTLNPVTYADSAAAQAAIVAVGASVEKEFNLNLTYEIEATLEQKNSLAGVLHSEEAGKSVSISLQVVNDEHLRMTLVDKGYNTQLEVPSSYNPANRGAGQHVYLIDTGLRHTHEQFAEAAINNLYTNFDNDPSIDDYNDTTGHGTTVGSLIVGKDLGAAKDATLHNVKLFNSAADNITVAEIVGALDAVLAHHQANNPSQVKVVCLPWVATRNAFIDQSVSALNAANLVVVCAAGNNGDDVANYSPAGLKNVITVGAYDNNWTVGSFTNMPWDGSNPQTTFNNYGAELDIFAMGVAVNAASRGSDTSYIFATGTSIATGVTAGVVAQHITKSPAYTADQIKDSLLQEGHIIGASALSFTALSAGVDYSGVNKSVVTFDTMLEDYLTTHPSGRIATLQSGQTTTVNLGLNPAATEVSALDFAPLPPWATFDTATGVVSIDTATAPAQHLPGTFVFAIKGKVNNVTKVEEFSIGIYTTSASDLADADQYYYDADAGAYDPVVSFQVAPNAQK